MDESLNYRFFQDWNAPAIFPGLPVSPLVRVYVDPQTKKLTIIDSDGENALAGIEKGPRSIIDVTDFGAVGDGIVDGLVNAIPFTATAHGSNVTANVTFTGLVTGFSGGDVGKTIVAAGGVISGIITAVLSATTVTVHGAVTSDNSGVVCWGTVNDAAFQAASAAVAAVLMNNGQQTIGPLPSSTVLYIPSGVYCLNLQNGSPISLGANYQGVTVQGDGSGQTVLAVVGQVGNGNVLACTGKIIGLSIEGNLIPTPFGGNAIQSGGCLISDVRIHMWGGFFGLAITGACTVYKTLVFECAINGIQVQGGNVDFFGCELSNNRGQGINFGNDTGSCRWIGGIIDESGATAGGGTPGNVVIENNNGNWVSFIDTTIYADSIDVIVSGGATVLFRGCQVVPFSGTGGLQIAAGSTVKARDTIFRCFASPGVTNYAINNSGVFEDNGGNTVAIESGTVHASQSGNTVTLTTNGANLGLAAQNIGQTIYVYGYTDVPAYNGVFTISAVPSPTTVQYQLVATGLATSTQNGHVGVLSKYGAGYTGNPPVVPGSQPTLSLALAALAADVTLMKWTPSQDSRLFRVTINSTATTSSSVAPVLTLSNGNVSKSITLTSGQNSWDSGVLTDTYFSQGLPVTISLTQGTSVTPPANLNIAIAYDGLGNG